MGKVDGENSWSRLISDMRKHWLGPGENQNRG